MSRRGYMTRKGFTLAEIMIVVAILVLLSALAIPNLIRARLAANEAAALSALKALVTAANTFRVSNPGYPLDLPELFDGWTPPYIDSTLASGTKQGYVFTFNGDLVDANGRFQGFSVAAVPVVEGRTGNRYFFVDASGVIRFSLTGDATVDDDPVE